VKDLPNIVQAGTPVLRECAEEVPVARIGRKDFQQLVQMMIAVMRKAPGVGLAAPQIGLPLRVFVLEDPVELMQYLTPEERSERERTPFPTTVFVNPRLRPIGDEKVGFFEGCLSVNGYAGYVERWREVEVTGLDQRGDEQTVRVKGWPARILQHEMDHLEGGLYIDRMLTRSFADAEIARRLYAGKPISEIRRLLGIA
jgi:peptide deformylase